MRGRVWAGRSHTWAVPGRGCRNCCRRARRAGRGPACRPWAGGWGSRWPSGCAGGAAAARRPCPGSPTSSTVPSYRLSVKKNKIKKQLGSPKMVDVSKWGYVHTGRFKKLVAGGIGGGGRGPGSDRTGVGAGHWRRRPVRRHLTDRRPSRLLHLVKLIYKLNPKIHRSHPLNLQFLSPSAARPRTRSPSRRRCWRARPTTGQTSATSWWTSCSASRCCWSPPWSPRRWWCGRGCATSRRRTTRSPPCWTPTSKTAWSSGRCGRRAPCTWKSAAPYTTNESRIWG